MDHPPSQLLPWLTQLMMVFDSINSSCIVIDASETIIAYNEVSARIDDIAASKVINCKLLTAFPSLTRDNSSMLNVLRSGNAIWNKPQSYQTATGKVMTLTSSTFPIASPDGEVMFVVEVVHDISNLRQLTDHVIHLTESLKEASHQASQELHIVTNNKQFKRVLKDVMCFAQTQLPVLIAGETGTGKELIARYLHLHSAQKNQTMVSLNCAAIPLTLIESTLFGTVKGAFSGAENKKGLLELADGGVLFLDEINSMPIEVQSKLLRVVQDGCFRPLGGQIEKKVNIRYISAMNEQPEIAIQKKQLRADFFYRLGVCMVVVPPLRDRLDDIPYLVECFIRKHNPLLNANIKGYTPDFIKALENNSWPGNIRMLENTLLRSMLMCSQSKDDVLNQLHLRDTKLPPSPQALINHSPADNSLDAENVQSLTEHLNQYEKQLLVNAMAHCNGNISKVARQFSIPRTTLQSKLKKFALTPN
jgi:arginine utilization regulatory protein